MDSMDIETDSINWVIQLFQYEQLFTLINKLKECGKYLWIRFWNPCFISMKEFIFSCKLSKFNSFISIFNVYILHIGLQN